MFRYIVRITLINLLLLALLLVTNQANADMAESDKPIITLQQALKLTLKQNPGLEIYRFRFKALNGELSTASLEPGYRLGVELENFGGNGEFNGIENSELTVSLSSAIELGGKLNARQGIVTAKSSYLETQKQLKTLELLSETARRYIELLSSQERIKLAQESVLIAQKTLETVKLRAKLGASMSAETRRAEAALTQAELTLTKEQSYLQISQMNLASMWGELNSSHFAVEGNLYQFGQDHSFEDLFEKVKNNPSIRQFTALDRLKQSELDLTEANNQSDLNWSVGLAQNQTTGDIGLKAGFSMGLFAESRNQGAYQKAQAAREENYVSKKTALLRMHSQLAKAYQHRQQSIKTVQRLQEEVIPALQSALEDSKKAYQRGRYSYLEYVSAQQELIAAKRKLIDEASATLMFGVTIEQLIAEPLTQAQDKL